MDDRQLNLTEAQKAVKSKYPPINKKYEYLDHTADVQIHSWGDSLEEAFEQCAMGMFGYMTDTETVEPTDTIEVESEGEDMESLLFHFLDDWLYKFCADLFFIPREVKVLHIDRMRFKIRSIGYVFLFLLPGRFKIKLWSVCNATLKTAIRLSLDFAADKLCSLSVNLILPRFITEL
uniref:Protein archease n=1 Tax=Echeneis naucrates TaxID=173247 RepID=A0A665W7X1_ECHNA